MNRGGGIGAAVFFLVEILLSCNDQWIMVVSHMLDQNQIFKNFYTFFRLHIFYIIKICSPSLPPEKIQTNNISVKWNVINNLNQDGWEILMIDNLFCFIEPPPPPPVLLKKIQKNAVKTLFFPLVQIWDF